MLTRRPASPSARLGLDDEAPSVVLLRGDPGRDVERQLQHQRARVVGDAAHHVQAAGRARDQHGGGRCRARRNRGGRRSTRVRVDGHARCVVAAGSARSSAAFASGAVSARKLPPPISGPARYLSRRGCRSGGWNAMKKWNASCPRWADVGRRLVQHHHVRKRHLPQVVEADSSRPTARAPAISTSASSSANTCGHAPLGRHVDLVRIAGEVGDERDRAVVFVQDAPAVRSARRE